MAGGKGTRISMIAPEIPKPMIKINNKPILEYEIECLFSQGFTDIIITVSYLGDIIMNYFGDGSRFGVKITYFCEEEPLGNAGALLKLWESGEIGRDENEDFLLLNADSIFDIDLEKFVEFHKTHGGLATLFTHPNSHPYDSGLIVADQNHQVTAWLTKEDKRPKYYKNRVNAGLHVLNTKLFANVGIDPALVGTMDKSGKTIKVDLDRQFLKSLAGTGKLVAYDSTEYVKDMGTPERFEQVCADFRNGRVKARNFRNSQKAIFLDRDGTINRYVGFLRDPEDFELLPEAAEAIKLINNSGYLAIIITNQPVIARGEITVSQLNDIHNKMETLLGLEGAYIDGLYYCPHHPGSGFSGEVKMLKINCDCRKPKPGLIFRAAQEYNIDLHNSWMVGDSDRDIVAGNAAGCKTILLSKVSKKGSAENELKNYRGMTPSYVAENLLEAIKITLIKSTGAESSLDEGVLLKNQTRGFCTIK